MVRLIAEIKIIDLTPFADREKYDISDYLAAGRGFSALKPVVLEVQKRKFLNRNPLRDLDWSQIRDLHKSSPSEATLGQVLTRMGIEYRFDERLLQAEIRVGDLPFRIAEEADAALIREMLREYAEINYGRGAKTAVWREAWSINISENRYDSFLDWLTTELPAWDQVCRISTWAIEHAGAEDTDLNRWASRYVFIASIQRASEPGAKLDEIPVYYASSGSGKSAFLVEIFPEHRQGRWSIDKLDFSLDDKQFLESISGVVVAECAEMKGISARHLGRVKAQITSRHDHVRLAYATQPTHHPRRCVFVATADRSACLPNDAAGNRRFVVLDWRHGFNVERWLNSEVVAGGTVREQLWAEALHEYRAGQVANLPRELQDVQANKNELYVSMDEGADNEMRKALNEAVERHGDANGNGFTFDDVCTYLAPDAGVSRAKLGDFVRREYEPKQIVRKGARIRVYVKKV